MSRSPGQIGRGVAYSATVREFRWKLHGACRELEMWARLRPGPNKVDTYERELLVPTAFLFLSGRTSLRTT
jgi:hypothetical protein